MLGSPRSTMRGGGGEGEQVTYGLNHHKLTGGGGNKSPDFCLGGCWASHD